MSLHLTIFTRQAFFTQYFFVNLRLEYMLVDIYSGLNCIHTLLGMD